MRIIAGEYRGREIERPKTRDVRPMSQLTREALFDILGPLEGVSFVDAYAGSGAIGFEALSRGAAKVVAIEKATAALGVIRRNAQKLGVEDRLEVAAVPVERWVGTAGEFDIIVAGPPFAALDVGVMDGLLKHVKTGGTLVVWHASKLDPPTLDDVMVKSRSYGESALSFYRKGLSKQPGV